MNLPTVEVTGVPITALSFEEHVDTMVSWGKRRFSRVVCVANVHMLMESRWNQHLRGALDIADMVTPDGMPLVWMMQLLEAIPQERVAGMDIFLSTCQECMDRDVSIFLLGSTPEVLSRMSRRLKREFPKLKITGVESPPFRPLSPSEDLTLVEKINKSGAGITFVSLGCPKQECWMAAHQNKIHSVMIGIGAVFPVYAGLQRHAPRWIRHSGLEWLYRLLQEPKRLFKRYLTTIPPFLWLAFRQVNTRVRS